jgi:pimeloyl-ACP methyl ester carboxylesterase
VLTRRELELAVWCWGDPAAPLLLMLHGWGDSGASFRFVADHLRDTFHVVAPDLRGFGTSGRAPGGYWFPDYLADVEAVAAHFQADGALALAGHSMGGNIAGLYAGVRPARVSHLVLLEGFGLPATEPVQAPGRYRRWLDALAVADAPREFESAAALRAHLARLAPRASPATLESLLEIWAAPRDDGRWCLRMDPVHKRVNPVLYRREEAAACWKATTAAVLRVAAAQSDYATRLPRFDAHANSEDCHPGAGCVEIEGAGHMLHWEQPSAVAACVREFLLRAN